jgi:hypothetical protein
MTPLPTPIETDPPFVINIVPGRGPVIAAECNELKASADHRIRLELVVVPGAPGLRDSVTALSAARLGNRDRTTGPRTRQAALTVEPVQRNETVLAPWRPSAARPNSPIVNVFGREVIVELPSNRLLDCRWPTRTARWWPSGTGRGTPPNVTSVAGASDSGTAISRTRSRVSGTRSP